MRLRTPIKTSVRDADFKSVKNGRFWDNKKVAVSPSRLLIRESIHCLWQWFYKAVRRNSKQNKIYLLKLRTSKYILRPMSSAGWLHGRVKRKNKIDETETRSDAPSRCEHRKATASGGGTFTCCAARRIRFTLYFFWRTFRNFLIKLLAVSPLNPPPVVLSDHAITFFFSR